MSFCRGEHAMLSFALVIAQLEPDLQDSVDPNSSPSFVSGRRVELGEPLKHQRWKLYHLPLVREPPHLLRRDLHRQASPSAQATQ